MMLWGVKEAPEMGRQVMSWDNAPSGRVGMGSARLNDFGREAIMF
jgi:hypothetical protein